MELYFLRHGESKSDLENKIESRYNAELTERGLKQAVKASVYFKSNHIEFDKIISSPLVRASKTAKTIAESQNLELEIDLDLSEIDRGVLCGMERKIADIKYPQ